jgi:hypothetical protein
MTGFNGRTWRKKLEDFTPTTYEYPFDAQPKLLREGVECACVNHQLSPALYSGVAQAAASLAVQGLAVLKLPDGSTIPLSMYFLIIAMSGMGKTRAFETFFAPFKARDMAAEATYAKELAEYPDKLRDYKKQRSDLNTLIGRMRAKGQPYDHLQVELENLKMPSKPRLRRWLMSDATGAAFLKRVQGFLQTVGLASDEGAKLFKHLYQYLADLCQGWSHGDIDSHRAGAGVTSAFNARITTLLLVQPKVFYDFCATQGDSAQGMGAWARFLINAPRKPSGHLTSMEGLADTTAPLNALLARIAELIAEYERRVKAGITEQDEVELDPDAYDGFRKFAQEMTERTVERGNDGKPGDLLDVSEFAAKAPIHAARLAAVFAYFCGDMKVTLDMMERAVSIVRYHIDAYRDQFSLSKAIPRIEEDAQQLETYFRKRRILTRGSTTVPLEFLRSNGRTIDLRHDEYLLPALQWLEDRGMVRVHNPTWGGKPYVDYSYLFTPIG